MKRIILTLIITLISLSAHAQIPRSFVSARLGNDANPCTLTSPCRNLQRGVDAVQAGGEVIPLDSGGYGTVRIMKPVTIAGPAGVHVGITTTDPLQQYAIVAFSSGAVNLRGITVSNLGGWGAIYFGGTGTMRVDSCVVRDGYYKGIVLSGQGSIHIYDTLLTRNRTGGVFIDAGTVASGRAQGTVDRVRASDSDTGEGFAAWTDSDLVVRNSVSFNNESGVHAASTSSARPTRITIEGTLIDGNTYGMSCNPQDPASGIIRVSNSTITHSRASAILLQTAPILSRGNNTVIDNAEDEVFSGTFSAK